ncbi:MAG: PAS domain S-box protein, partial [Chloroflexota bacterium]
QIATAIDRKQAEEHLRLSQTSLEMAQTVGQMGSWDLDLELGHGYWSNEMYHLMGRNPAAGVPDFSEFLKLIHPEDRRTLLDAQQLAIDLEEPTTTIYRANLLSKQPHYFEARIQPIRDDQGKVRKLSGTLLDITKRRLAELEVGERVKELTCLFTISRLLEGYSIPEPFVYQQIVDSLLPAMQFPLLAAALVELDEERYFTERYSENLTCCMSTEIIVAGKRRGHLSVFYTRDEAFIIPEEQDLIDNLARMLAQWLIRVQIEKSLRESNERFNQLADNIQESFWIYDTVDNKLIYISPTSEVIWGRSLQTLYDNPSYYRDYALPEDITNLLEADEKQNQGEATNIEYRIRRPDGSLRWVWDRAFPIFDQNGKMVRTAGVTTDITDLKVAQQALHELNRDLENRVEERTAEVRQNEVTYRALFENSNDGIFLISPEGIELRANHQALLMLGYSQEEWQGYTYSQLVVPEEKQDADQRFESVLHGEHVPLYERTFIRKDGKKVEVEINLSAVRDDNGKIILVQSVVRDITNRKHAEYALKANSELFDKFMLHSPIYTFVKDVTPERSLVLYASENYIDMIGVTGSQMVGKTMHAFFPSEFADKITADDWDVVSKGEMITIEEELNGRSYTSIKFPIIQGERTLLAGYTIDITERKKAEETLRESEDRYRLAISSADAVPYSLDYHSNRYTFMGESIERLTGYSREEMTPDLFNSSTVEAKFSGELAGKSTMEVVQLVRSGAANPNGVLRSDFRIVTKTGVYRWLADSSVQVLDDQGHFSGSIGILLDITDRKEAEETLRESRDMLSAANISLEKASRMKDEFLASMSHELRTPLTGILGLAEALQLQTQGPLNDRQLKAMGNIEKSGRHLLELINDILDLSKIEAGKMELELEPFSVADVCQASLQLVKGMAHQKKINTSFSMNMSPLVLKADSRRLKQMLVNLLSNAIKFTPTSGQIGLEVEARPDQMMVCFHVWDKGIGIRSEEMGKLFQPFVQLDSSLARQYAGTGLGLSLVHRMAELHGGSVQVESNPGQGSRFSILLPWYEDEPEHQPDQPENEPFQVRNTLTIEDNDLDAEQIARYLKEIGIANILQPVVRGALEKAASLHPSAILLDLNLPDGSGLDLLTKLKANEQTRDIPVIITSVEDRQTDARHLGASDYLVKPYKQEDLRIALAKVAALQANHPVMVIGKNELAPLVLVADDNELILETLSEFLTSSGFRVIAVHSGYELLKQAAEHQPDICLVDIQMPGMDGLETMRRMRAHGNLEIANTPMIAITALAMSGDRERCLRAGANEYMSKPIIMKQLVKMIIQILARKTPPAR